VQPANGRAGCYRLTVDRKDIVVIGASAGGMEALERLVGGLPADLAAALFVVWHLPPGMRTILPLMLSRAGPLSAAHPQDGDPILPGRIYVAPNDHHLLLEQGYVRVTKGPKENRFRPAVDPLFRSAAYVYGPRVIGIVLSGALDDGTAGLWTIKQRGGTAIVQEPADARHRSMPLNALEHTDADHRLPAADIGGLLGRLTREPAAPTPALAAPEEAKMRGEIRIAEGREAIREGLARLGVLSPFTCPECQGVLTLLREGSLVRFRCHTGHALSSGTLLQGTSEKVEEKLWEALRALDEVVLLLNELGEQRARAGDTRAAAECFQKAREAHQRAEPIRAAAMRSEALTVSPSRGEKILGE
jgi:two-component system, chemotaxis family, protein-glutamate methylesterase/glutaminase